MESLARTRSKESATSSPSVFAAASDAGVPTPGWRNSFSNVVCTSTDCDGRSASSTRADAYPIAA